MSNPLSAEELRTIIDMYMPTIITGIDHVSTQSHRKDREDWDENDIAIMAAYSYAHNMLKRLGAPQDVRDFGDVDYDLPSVIDLLQNLKARSRAIDETVAAFPETRSILGRYEGRLFGPA